MADKGNLTFKYFDGDSYIPISRIKVYVNKSVLYKEILELI